MTWFRRPAVPIALGALLLGIVVRLAFLDYETPDFGVFLLPWYVHARDHGWSGIGAAWTDYTPFYGYLLIVASKFDGLAAPLTLIKFISYPFEFGSALIAARLASLLDPRPERAALVFAAAWLAPSVLHNGAFWGQCDAIWTFFLLASLLAFCRERPELGIGTFGMAIAVKLQAIFLGPLVLAIVLRRRVHWVWLAAIPAVYVASALPDLVMGRPLPEVLNIYLRQAGAYQSLWKGAPNLYLLVPDTLYRPFTVGGLLLSGCAGLAFAIWVARAPRLPPEHLLLAAAFCLALMPFLLPKMHDRYFYAFELLIIVLAGLRPVLVPVAAIAQVNSTLCYLPFDGRGDLGQAATGFSSLIILVFLFTLLRRALAGGFGALGTISGDRNPFVRAHAALWGGFAIQVGLLAAASSWIDAARFWPHVPTDPRGLVLFGLVLLGIVGAAAILERRHRATGSAHAQAPAG